MKFNDEKEKEETLKEDELLGCERRIYVLNMVRKISLENEGKEKDGNLPILFGSLPVQCKCEIKKESLFKVKSRKPSNKIIDKFHLKVKKPPDKRVLMEKWAKKPPDINWFLMGKWKKGRKKYRLNEKKFIRNAVQLFVKILFSLTNENLIKVDTEIELGVDAINGCIWFVKKEMEGAYRLSQGDFSLKRLLIERNPFSYVERRCPLFMKIAFATVSLVEGSSDHGGEFIGMECFETKEKKGKSAEFVIEDGDKQTVMEEFCWLWVIKNDQRRLLKERNLLNYVLRRRPVLVIFDIETMKFESLWKLAMSFGSGRLFDLVKISVGMLLVLKGGELKRNKDEEYEVEEDDGSSAVIRLNGSKRFAERRTAYFKEIILS
jgi:hypothetical protein